MAAPGDSSQTRYGITLLRISRLSSLDALFHMR